MTSGLACKKGDVTCTECGAGFRRLELELSTQSAPRARSPSRRMGELLEKFNGNALIAYRLTLQPSIKGIRD